MSESQAEPTVDTEARRAALEILATLANVKKIAADRLLRPAGIPDPLIQRFLKGKDATTGEALSKRQAASLIFDELARNGQDHAVIRKLLDIAADWTSFELAHSAGSVQPRAKERY
jgi:hypothetical protein